MLSSLRSVALPLVPCNTRQTALACSSTLKERAAKTICSRPPACGALPFSTARLTWPAFSSPAVRPQLASTAAALTVILLAPALRSHPLQLRTLQHCHMSPRPVQLLHLPADIQNISRFLDHLGWLLRHSSLPCSAACVQHHSHQHEGSEGICDCSFAQRQPLMPSCSAARVRHHLPR